MEEIIKKFLSVSDGYGSGVSDGYGDGDGDGDGDGSGSGYGDGYGDGDGDGDGDGYGYGYGDGYGSGSGSGSGYGYGDGDGYGDGYGDGSGSGIEKMNGRQVYMIDDTPTFIDSVHGNYAKGSILNSDLTETPCFIAKVGDCFAHGETLKAALEAATEKYEENLPVGERIKRFNAQYPDRDRKIPAKELFNWHHTLTGSCLMGRQNFCREHGLDYENGEYTVKEFISLTENAYGGEVIRQLEESRP